MDLSSIKQMMDYAEIKSDGQGRFLDLGTLGAEPTPRVYCVLCVYVSIHLHVCKHAYVYVCILYILICFVGFFFPFTSFYLLAF